MVLLTRICSNANVQSLTYITIQANSWNVKKINRAIDINILILTFRNVGFRKKIRE